MPPPDITALLFDIQHAAGGIVLFTTGKSLDDYKGDRMLRSAVERQFEIIGEAMTRLRAKAPDLVERITDYRKIISFRNVLIHGYDSVNDEITWRIVVEKVPILQREVEELLKA